MRVTNGLVVGAVLALCSLLSGCIAPPSSDSEFSDMRPRLDSAEITVVRPKEGVSKADAEKAIRFLRNVVKPSHMGYPGRYLDHIEIRYDGIHHVSDNGMRVSFAWSEVKIGYRKVAAVRATSFLDRNYYWIADVSEPPSSSALRNALATMAGYQERP